MTTFNPLLKALLSSFATLALAGTAVAQANPPTTTSPQPATGAGQQSTQQTPMGTTGTSGANTAPGTGAAGTTMTDTTPGAAGSMAGSSGTTAMDTTQRPARADRN